MIGDPSLTQTSPKFYPLLYLYHLLPLHFPLTLFAFDAPFGRFTPKSTFLTVNGNIAWFCMEIVSPISFIYTLSQHAPLVGFGATSSTLAGLFLFHYIHRSIISPLFLSPKRSPQHIVVSAAAAAFNLLNGYAQAIGLIYYPSSLQGWKLQMLLAVWALGLAGNIYHDEILNDLRRPVSKKLIGEHSAEEKEDKKVKASKGRYAIPRAALFDYVSFPNYLCEWIEWTSWAIADAPSVFIPMPPPDKLALPPFVDRILEIAPWPRALLHPAWIFPIFLVSSMLPRAIRAHQWYKTTFGDRFPRDRKYPPPPPVYRSPIPPFPTSFAMLSSTSPSVLFASQATKNPDYMIPVPPQSSSILRARY